MLDKNLHRNASHYTSLEVYNDGMFICY